MSPKQPEFFALLMWHMCIYVPSPSWELWSSLARRIVWNVTINSFWCPRNECLKNVINSIIMFDCMLLWIYIYITAKVDEYVDVLMSAHLRMGWWVATWMENAAHNQATCCQHVCSFDACCSSSACADRNYLKMSSGLNNFCHVAWIYVNHPKSMEAVNTNGF